MNKILKKYKVYIIILLLIIVYFVVFSIISGKVKTEDEKYASIIVDGIGIWEYKDREWHNILEDELEDSGDLYNLYSANGYIGEYTVRVNNSKLYAFDSNYDSLQYEGSIMAVKSNYNVNVVPFNYSSVSGNDEVILSDVVNKYSSYQAHTRKISVDVDNDEIDDTLYIVDYYSNNDKLFSEIYLYNDDSDLIPIVEYTGAHYIYYDVSYVLDIDNDDMCEVIVSSDYYGNISYKVYKIDENKSELFLE